jgi:hypothetical protein
MGEERLDDESKTSSKDDTSGDSKPIVKQWKKSNIYCC